MNSEAKFSAVRVESQGMKWASLENRSMTVRIISLPLEVIGRFVMKSQLIDSQGLDGVGNGSSSPGVFLLESFPLAQTWHVET